MGLTTASVSFKNGNIQPEQYEQYEHIQFGDRIILRDGRLLDEDIHRIAKKLSKAGMCFVTSFFYFDDDGFVLSLYHAGKTVTIHNYGLNGSRRGKPEAFTKEFGLDEQGVKLLRAGFKIDSITEQLQCIESILKCPLAAMAPQDSYSFLSLQEVQNKINKLKIKNKTKAELLFELPGEIRYCEQPPYFIQNGRLMRLDGNNSIIIMNETTSPNNAYVFEDFYAGIWSLINGNRVEYFDKKGNLTGALTIENVEINFAFLICPDGSVIYTEKGLSVKKVNRQGHLEWQIPRSHTIRQHEDSTLICLIGEKYSYGQLDCVAMVDKGGTVYAKHRFEEITTDINVEQCDRVSRYGEISLFLENGLLAYDYMLSDHGIRIHVLLFFDKNLNVIKRFEYDKLSQHFSMMQDRRKNRLFLIGSGDFSVLAMDTFALEKTVNHPWDSVPLHVDGNIYIRQGYSTLCVYDDSFTLISKHTLKGFIIAYYGDSDAGNPRFLTCTASEFDPPVTRCYEVAMK